MGRFESAFELGENFKKYIESIGFLLTPTHTSSTYYVNEKGNQIRTDKSGFINLIDNKGFIIESSRRFSVDELLNFSNN